MLNIKDFNTVWILYCNFIVLVNLFFIDSDMASSLTSKVSPPTSSSTPKIQSSTTEIFTFHIDVESALKAIKGPGASLTISELDHDSTIVWSPYKGLSSGFSFEEFNFSDIYELDDVSIDWENSGVSLKPSMVLQDLREIRNQTMSTPQQADK